MSEEDRLYRVIKAAFVYLALYTETNSVGYLNAAIGTLMPIVQEREGTIDADKLVNWLENYAKSKQTRN